MLHGTNNVTWSQGSRVYILFLLNIQRPRTGLCPIFVCLRGEGGCTVSTSRVLWSRSLAHKIPSLYSMGVWKLYTSSGLEVLPSCSGASCYGSKNFDEELVYWLAGGVSCYVNGSPDLTRTSRLSDKQVDTKTCCLLRITSQCCRQTWRQLANSPSLTNMISLRLVMERNCFCWACTILVECRCRFGNTHDGVVLQFLLVGHFLLLAYVGNLSPFFKNIIS